MYQIFADDTLIYDSTLEDYKIGSGQITKELDKSGSFVFSLYPDHFFYHDFVKLKTVVTVKKSGKIVFRGRVLNDATDYWNTGTFTCEGELGFLRDSVIRPFEFQGKPEDLFKKFINEHNAQVDEFKRFKIGDVTVEDANNYINRSTYEYPTALDVMGGALTGSNLGGHFYITHGDDGTDPVPTIHYVADFPKTATQSIEFGVNLRDYTKTATAEAVATAIIPLGTETETTGQRLTIKEVNDGQDYVYSEAGVALYGWVFKTVVWEDVTLAQNLKTKAEAYLDAAVNQNITVELNAIDLHLLDRSIESFNVCEYVQVSSAPHGFNAVLLCNKQTLDLLNPERDTVVLGYHVATFTQASTEMAASVSTLGKTISTIRQDAKTIQLSVEEVEQSMAAIELQANSLSLSVTNGSTSASIQLVSQNEEGKTENVGSPVTIQMNGLVTFSGLSDGTTTIDGGCIKTGTISADRIEASKLKIDAAQITGTLTIGKQLPSDLATTGQIPTKTSQLTNNSGLAYASQIPTQTSQLTNNSGFVNASGVTTIVEGVVTADYVNALGVYASELVSSGAWGTVSIYGGHIEFPYGYIYGEYSNGLELVSDTSLLLCSSSNGYVFVESGGAKWYLHPTRGWIST